MPRFALPLCALALACSPLQAAPPLPDPTQPPLLQVAPPPAAYGLRHPLRLSAARAAEAPVAPAPALPQVQSVRVPRQGPPSALVDGRLLRPGDRLTGPWGERSVASIDEQGLTLVPGPRDRTALRLWLLGTPAPTATPGATTFGATPPPPTPPAQLAGRSTP